jgi:hypothetical protein
MLGRGGAVGGRPVDQVPLLGLLESSRQDPVGMADSQALRPSLRHWAYARSSP